MTFAEPTSRLPAPFAAYVAPATVRPQLWRLFLGLILCIFVYVAWVAGLLWTLWRLSGTERFAPWSEPILQGRTPGGTLVLLVTFLGMALGPILAARLLHKRSAGTLFGRGAVVLRDFATAAGIVLAVFAVGMALWALHFDAIPNVDFTLWLTLLPLSLAGILLQTGAEELVFRGYLQQQLAARFRSPLMWLVLPGLVFGLVHFDPVTSGGNVWLVILAATAFGLAAADLTAVTGSLGAAWGFHFANNAAALLFVALNGPLSGLALFKAPYAADDLEVLPGLILVDLGVLALTWALVRRAVRR